MQNYKNHRSYYAAHHLVFYPLTLLLAAITFKLSLDIPEQHFAFASIAIAFILICWLSFMMRQHYGLGNQDRIIRLEMRLRYFQLTGTSFEPLENQLTRGQIIALRFASDEELPDLIKRAIAEALSSNDIKKSIQNWKSDYMRV